MNPFKVADGSKQLGPDIAPGQRSASDARASAPPTPLTGRDTELSLLKDRWEQAQEGMGQFVLVIGEAGLGKSRLVQTLARAVEEDAGFTVLGDRRPVVIEWRCSEQFQNSELYPVTDYWDRLLGSDHDSSPADRFERLARYLEDFNIARPEIVALFAKLLLLPPDERYPEAGLSPAREREETFSALREWLLAHARACPVLFVVEDLHWIDASTLEFLKQFTSEGPHDRILTVLTFRPEFRTSWPALAHQTNLALNRLTRRQVADWMRRDAGDRLPEALVAQIYHRTGGVPLLVEEFSRLACESAMFAASGGASRPGPSVSARELPATLQELVLARLEQMSCNRDVAQVAATIGREFGYDLLAAVVALDDEILRAELSKLLAAGILYVAGQPPASSYLFKHVLIEEALYSAIGEARRRQFHQKVADVIETQFTHLVETQPERLADHLAEAGSIERAIGFCLKAGMRSCDRCAHAEAIGQFSRGLKLLESLPPSGERDTRELELLGPLGTATIAARGYAAPEVGPIFQRARALCERVEQRPELFTMMWGNFAFHIVRGDFRICSELAEEAMTFAERFGDPGLLMEALFLKGLTRLYRGDFAGARDCCARAVAEFDDRERNAFWARLVGEDAGVTHRCYLALALWHLGFPEQALNLNDEMVQLARSLNHPFSLEYALHHTGWLRQHCRLGAKTQLAGEEQVRVATEQGFLFWHASGTLYSAAGMLLQGRLEPGIRLLQTGLEAYRGTGAELAVPYYLSVLAEGCLRAGRFAEAHAALDEALSLVEKNDERFQEAELYRLRGELILAESDHQEAAQECFLRAVQTARGQQSRAWELRATTSLARLWKKRGRTQEAFKALSSARDAFHEGFTTPDLVEAAGLLESLSDERMRAEFAAGVKYVRDCMPPPLDGPVSVDWRYLPASTLGGDTIGYHWVNDGNLAMYLIDVTGHGLDAALLSVSVANVIRAGALPEADMKRPDQVLAKLNDAFRGEQHGHRFFTIWYGVYNCAARTLTWAGGGHPPAIVLAPGNTPPRLLPSSGMMMGVLRGKEFPAQSCQIPEGACLLIFSDGVFEILRDGRDVWNLDACVVYLASAAASGRSIMDDLLNHVYHLRGSPHLDDDFSIIEAWFR